MFKLSSPFCFTRLAALLYYYGIHLIKPVISNNLLGFNAFICLIVDKKNEFLEKLNRMQLEIDVLNTDYNNKNKFDFEQ